MTDPFFRLTPQSNHRRKTRMRFTPHEAPVSRIKNIQGPSDSLARARLAS